MNSASNLRYRQRKAEAFRLFCRFVTWLSIIVLAILLLHITWQGIKWLDWQFLTSFPSRFPARAGVKAALIGTLWLIALTAMISVPVGVGAAVYLEQFAPKNRFHKFIDINIANLAGVPSIVYGLLGLTLFVRWLSLERSLLAGSMTMSLLILPVVIIAAREAIRAVPESIAQAAFALGATRWQTVYAHTLPAALPGIITGIILAMSRAIGETAPLIMIGALTFAPFVPQSPMDEFTALPIQIYNWISRPQHEFHQVAAAGILVLMIALLTMNAAAVYIRHRSERSARW